MDERLRSDAPHGLRATGTCPLRAWGRSGDRAESHLPPSRARPICLALRCHRRSLPLPRPREPGRIRKETQITPQLERIRDTAETPLTKQVQGAANSYAQPWRSIVLDSSPNRVCHATLHLGQDVPQARKNGCRNTAFQAATSLCKRQDVDGATVGHKRSNVLF